jgi:hypothetical protein
MSQRRTADGKTVILWSDGLLTFGMGFGIPGVGRARSAYARNRDTTIGWIVMDDVALYDAADVAALVAAARRAHAKPGSTEDTIRSDMRRSMRVEA